MRQIASTVSFLPLIEDGDPCSFELMIFTKKNTTHSDDWEKTIPPTIVKPEAVRLRSFSTQFHSISTQVEYTLQN